MIEDGLWVYNCPECDELYHSKEEIQYCSNENCEDVKLIPKGFVPINVELEWENGSYWGKFTDDIGNVYEMYMGVSGQDVYSKPVVDEYGDIYSHGFCLDSNTIWESIHMGVFEGYSSLVI